MKIIYTDKINYERYNELREAVGWKRLSSRQVENALSNPSFLVVAEYNGEAIGMTRVVYDGGYIALIVDVIIHPDFQGKGIGREVFTRAIDYIRSRLVEGESIMINLMAAKGKDTFYEKFGFESRPTDEFGPGMHQWIYYEEIEK